MKVSLFLFTLTFREESNESRRSHEALMEQAKVQEFPHEQFKCSEEFLMKMAIVYSADSPMKVGSMVNFKPGMRLMLVSEKQKYIDLLKN